MNGKKMICVELVFSPCRLIFPVLGGLIISLMMASASIAQPTQRLRFSEWDWLFGRCSPNPDACHPPSISRGDVCLLVPSPGIREHRLWSNKPLFVFRGSPAPLAIVRQSDDRQIWSEMSLRPTGAASASALMTVAYDGLPLRDGEAYLLQVYSPIDLTTKMMEIPFQVLSASERQLINNDLAAIESQSLETGGNTEAIAMQRAEYFGQQNLTMDAWRELVAVASTSSSVDQLLQDSAARFCTGG
jgi:hypothetical protein